jgi:ADP-heptose:LPS heptosyltransferase
MIFFKVSQNINIKIADNSLVVLNKENRGNDENEYIYITTFHDFEAVKKIFEKVGTNYKTYIIDEKKVFSGKDFPIEIGVSNKNEFLLQKQKLRFTTFLDEIPELSTKELFRDEEFKDIFEIVKSTKKEISIAIIGGIGRGIGEILCGLTAIRVLVKTLQKKYKGIKVDLFLESADNQYYKRDKELLEKEPLINKVLPLCINVKKMSEYDYYIDTSAINENTFYKELNFVDAYLYKFGINYKNIPLHLKFNQFDLSFYQPSAELQDDIIKLKNKSELILFHPYSPDIQRSLPKDVSATLLKELLTYCDETVVSTLKIEKVENDKYVDLSKHSKTLFDFMYIISQCDYIITVDTATYHISDLFLIPTVVIFPDDTLVEKRVKYYKTIKPYILKEKKKNLSLLRFENDTLTVSKYTKYKDIKAKKIIKLLKD